MDGLRFEWAGDPGDQQTCRSVPGYVCVAEDMGDDWFAAVYRAGVPAADPAAAVLHSGDAGILPLTGVAARRLCELAVRADVQRRGG